ncbi:MAG TPA: phosphatase PAP2 family protein [Flavobacterium sp.]|nr:phosphatase PAP2 family protein [Flavobacterium sp.]
MKKKITLWLSLIGVLTATAQEQIIIGNDTLVNQSGATTEKRSVYKQLTVPAILVGYGAIGLGSKELKTVNREIKSYVNENVSSGTSIDDYTRYAPTLSVYALNALGIKGKHNFRDRTIIMVTSQLIMCGTTMSLKKLSKIERPDGSTFNSFPSGHTATAFAGAEFLWQEYKDVSVWYGVTGYIVAGATGLLRIYNDRHWLTDVAAGAGIGILSTKIAYWIHPLLRDTFFGEEKKVTAMAAPFYNGEQIGLSVVLRF